MALRHDLNQPDTYSLKVGRYYKKNSEKKIECKGRMEGNQSNYRWNIAVEIFREIIDTIMVGHRGEKWSKQNVVGLPYGDFFQLKQVFISKKDKYMCCDNPHWQQ